MFNVDRATKKKETQAMGLKKIKAFVKRICIAAFDTVSKPTIFVVISRGRTGSNLLMSLLDSHPRISIRGSIIGESVMANPSRKDEIVRMGTVPYLKQCFKRTGFESAVGIKILYYQVEHVYEKRNDVRGLKDLMDFIISHQGIRIIHLKRRNRLETLTSIRVAAFTKKYRLLDGPEKTVDATRITLSPEESEREFRQIEEWENLYGNALNGHKTLEVYYEDLSQNTATECNRIFDFLGVHSQSVNTHMQKQRRRPLEQVIENYNDLKKYFEGTEYARFFEEPASDE